jgi:hypothetical protein
MVTKSDKILLGNQLNQLGAGVQCSRDLLYRHYKGNDDNRDRKVFWSVKISIQNIITGYPKRL